MVYGIIPKKLGSYTLNNQDFVSLLNFLPSKTSPILLRLFSRHSSGVCFFLAFEEAPVKRKEKHVANVPSIHFHTPRNLTCPLKGDHFKERIVFQTSFSGGLLVFGGVLTSVEQ